MTGNGNPARSLLVAGAIGVAVSAGPLGAQRSPTEPPAAGEGRRPPGIALPDGEGRALVETACTSCHDLAGVSAFKGYWNRERWASMVTTMIEHGARLDESEAQIVVDYLTAHFGREDTIKANRGVTP